MNQKLYIVIFCLLLVGCSFFKKTDSGQPIARVNDSFLYQEDIKGVVPKGVSQQDSALMVNAFINRWAQQLLLMDGAKINLSVSKQTSFSQLIQQYKVDLYTNAYLEGLVKKNIDTLVSEDLEQQFYEANKESFRLNDDLLQFRYINLPLNAINLDTITKRFKRFNADDKRYLDSIAVQFKSYVLNDSLWVKFSSVTDKIAVINSENKNQLLKKSNFLQLKDSLNLYLMHVNDVKTLDDYAPLDYVKNSIKQIVINKRKLELIKQLEKDIIKDAIKNNKFEIFN